MYDKITCKSLSPISTLSSIYNNNSSLRMRSNSLPQIQILKKK